MQNYTDKLIEAYITEDNANSIWTPLLVSDAEREQAEKDFWKDLYDGPAKTITLPNGSSFEKHMGKINLLAFHKAYDKFFSDNDMLDIFSKFGEIYNSKYGELKNFSDQKNKAIKAAKELWAASNKTDDENNLEIKDLKEYEIADKEFAREKEKEFIDTVKHSQEWKDLLEEYKDDKFVNDIDVICRVETISEVEKNQIFTKKGASQAFNLFSNNNHAIGRVFYFIEGVFCSPNVDRKTANEVHAALKITDNTLTKAYESIKEKIIHLIKVHQGIQFVLEQQVSYKEREDYKFFEAEAAKMDGELNWVCYWDAKTWKYYLPTAITTRPITIYRSEIRHKDNLGFKADYDTEFWNVGQEHSIELNILQDIDGKEKGVAISEKAIPVAIKIHQPMRAKWDEDIYFYNDKAEYVLFDKLKLSRSKIYKTPAKAPMNKYFKYCSLSKEAYEEATK